MQILSSVRTYSSFGALDSASMCYTQLHKTDIRIPDTFPQLCEYSTPQARPGTSTELWPIAPVSQEPRMCTCTQQLCTSTSSTPITSQLNNTRPRNPDTSCRPLPLAGEGCKPRYTAGLTGRGATQTSRTRLKDRARWPAGTAG